jgi:TonB family protein
MNPLLFVAKLTTVLLIGVISALLLRRADAALRHCVCAIALACAVVFAFMGSIAPAPLPSKLEFVVDAVTAASSNHPAPFRWLFWCWALGASVVGLRLLTGFIWLYRLTRRSTLIDLSAEDWRWATAVPCRLRIAPIRAPLVWGWFRPVVLFPSVALDWTTDAKRFALLHELAHVERRDNWTLLLAKLVETVYWFHPLVWWLSARLGDEQELACDDRVLAAGVSAAAYAEMLIGVARKHSSVPALACGMIRRKSQLRSRVMHVLRFSSAAKSPKIARLAIVPAVASMLIAALAFPVAAARDSSRPPAAAPLPLSAAKVPPKLLYKIEPQYTKEAARKKIQGTVMLAITVDTDGIAKDIDVIKGIDKGLDRNAVAAIAQWRFQPASKNNEPVPFRAHVEVNFRLK